MILRPVDPEIQPTARPRRRRRRTVAVVVGVAVAAAAAAVATLAVLDARSGHIDAGTTATGDRPPPAAVRPPDPGPELRRLTALGLPVYRAGDAGRYVALTFDDGPGPFSADTLGKLAAAGARATFFDVGRNVAPWRSLLARERAMGAVGDHTWSHPFLPHLTAGARRRQIVSTRRAEAAAGAGPVDLFRPPYGGRDAAIDRQIRRLGMVEVLWSVDSGDSEGADAPRIVRNVIRGLRPGAIILLHENRGQTQKALNRLLPAIRRRGYGMVSVPELLALDPPSVAQIRSDARGSRLRHRAAHG